MEVSPNSHSKSTSTPITPRNEVVTHLDDYRKEYEKSASQRQAIRNLNLPRGTVRYWLKQEKQEPDFFKGETGSKFLHQIYVALHLCFRLKGDCSIELIREFLTLSGLSMHIASSHGSIHNSTTEMEDIIIEFGGKEDKRLGKLMPHKRVSFTLDEAFYKSIPYLVAIEPISNFIL